MLFEKLRSAILENKVDELENLLKNVSNVNIINENRQTSLFFSKNVETAKVLIEKGANLNFRDAITNTYSHSPLDYACASLNKYLVKFYLEELKRINMKMI